MKKRRDYIHEPLSVSVHLLIQYRNFPALRINSITQTKTDTEKADSQTRGFRQRGRQELARTNRWAASCPRVRGELAATYDQWLTWLRRDGRNADYFHARHVHGIHWRATSMTKFIITCENGSIWCVLPVMDSLYAHKRRFCTSLVDGREISRKNHIKCGRESIKVIQNSQRRRTSSIGKKYNGHLYVNLSSGREVSHENPITRIITGIP